MQRGTPQVGQKRPHGEKEDLEEKYERVMAEEDPELEKELEEAGLIEARDDTSVLDEKEFLEHADELDLPDEEEDNEQDLKGEDTDSDMEDYYRELGIENEEDEVKGKSTKTKPKKKAVVAKLPVGVTKEEARRKVLDELIDRTKSAPTYANLTRVIKIVKQVFFAGNSAAGDEGEEEEKKKPAKKDKNLAITAILLGNAGEYKRLLEFFSQEVPKLILKICSIAEKIPKEGQVYDLKKTYGHLSTKQQMLLKTYAANYNKLLTQTVEEGADSAFVQEFLVSGVAIAMVSLPYGLYRKKLASNYAKICVSYSHMEETSQVLAFQGLRALILFYNQST